MKENKLRVIKAEVNEELKKLKQILRLIETTLEKIRNRHPDELTRVALGGLLHSFYNGVERIMLKIVKSFEQEVPAGLWWHTDLLNRMVIEIPGIRPALWSQDTADTLMDYMGFRHIFRSSYGFELKWNKMHPLLVNAKGVFVRIKAEINTFFNKISKSK